MISSDSHSIGWIRQVSAKLGKRGDPKLLEKVIYAFTLLESLHAHGLKPIFKGGTSLLLTTDRPRRFSIDIDIITQASKTELHEIFTAITSAGLFSRWEDNSHRKMGDAPIGHYKFYYKSAVDQYVPEEPVLLDILFSSNPYPLTKQYPIKHEWLITDGALTEVTIPVFESLLGDKLTAFAPKTTGILYSKNRPVDIIKQLHDIGHLYDLSEDFSMIKKSYLKVVSDEIAFRKLAIEPAEVLQDTWNTCLVLSQRQVSDPEFKELQKGISNISNSIIDRFNIEIAITAAAKAAYLVSQIAQESGKLIRFENPKQVADKVISEKNGVNLNKLKKSNPEAFYFWSSAFDGGTLI